jgi:DUF4097 and DUF4098 domain-containing protein YvlB
MAVLAAGVIATPALLGAQEQTETINETVALPSGGRVELKNFSGAIRVTTGSGNDVVITAVRRAEQEQLDNIKLDISTSGSTVKINANDRNPDWESKENNVVETEFDIQVPAGASLDIDAFSSQVDVTGVTGDQKVKTFSGKITITGARGAIEATAFNGDVEIDLSAAGSTPDLQAETFSGDIDIDLSGDASGRLDFTTFSGSLDSDLSLSDRDSSRRRTRADLPGGSSGNTLRFKTFSGDVRVR